MVRLEVDKTYKFKVDLENNHLILNDIRHFEIYAKHTTEHFYRPIKYYADTTSEDCIFIEAKIRLIEQHENSYRIIVYKDSIKLL